MNVHIPTKSRLSKAQRRAVREYDNEQKEETFRRWTKLVCVALHARYGFGHDRCTDFLGEISRLAEEAEKDEIFWIHIDNIVIKELRLSFEKEDYEGLDK